MFSALQFIYPQTYSTDKIVRVGGDYNYPPFEYLHDSYIPRGFNVDIIRAVAKTMQLNIELDLEPWGEIRKKLDSGKIDMLQGMYYSEERAGQYLFSSPHLTMNQAVFRRKNSPPYTSASSLKGREVIVQKGDIMHEYAVKNSLTDKLIPVESPEDGLRLLASGKHDYLLSSRITGLYWINELKLKNITTGDNIVSFKYCFAVSKDNPELLTTLNEGLIIIQQTGVYNEIYEKWFSRLEPEMYIFKKAYKTILIVISSLISLLLIFVLWSWSLKNTVIRRTRALEKEIEEHKKADLELHESRELYRRLFSDFTDAVLIYDFSTGEIVNFNKKVCDIYGVPEYEMKNFTLKNLFDIGSSSRLKMHIKNVITYGYDSYDADFTNRKGEEKYLIIKSKKMNINGKDLVQSIGIDITEKKLLEGKLLQAGKLEAVGTLAGGIAHDFNNILAAIIGYSEIAMMSVGEGNPGWDEISEILKAGNRAKDIVKQILLFSRKDNLEKIIVDPGVVLDESWNFLRSAIPTTVQMIKNKALDLKKIMASPTQIYQILLNLCTNSSQSMEETGGIIRVEIRNAVVREKGYIRISVSDTGHGLDPETLDKIFDPYFTTKDVGKGSGLGLAVVHGIVEESGGFIDIENYPGEGVTFNIYLPVADAENETEKAAETEWRGGKETIIIIDDEEAVADIVARYLQTAGYEVIKETDSRKALETINRRIEEINLVITDQTMPGITGLEIAAEVKSRSNIPVVIITGYSTRINIENAEDYRIDKILLKPINRNDLLKEVREILDREK